MTRAQFLSTFLFGMCLGAFAAHPNWLTFIGAMVFWLLTIMSIPKVPS